MVNFKFFNAIVWKSLIYAKIKLFNTIISHEHMKISRQKSSVSILGEAIEAERKRRKLTQGQLASLSNTSINFISQIERGKKTAQIGKVIDVLQILGVQLVIEKGPAGVVNHYAWLQSHQRTRDL